MARKTYLELRQAGGVIAGNDAADDWITTKMNAWFRKHYAAYPWPFLITQAAGVTMDAGSELLVVGAGDNDVSKQISRIFSPIYFRANGYSTRGRAPVREVVGDAIHQALGMVDAANQTGTPQSFVALPVQEGDGLMKMSLLPYPVPEKEYKLAFTYQYLPNDLDNNDIPLYPNEMTLIQACKCAALEYDETGSQLLKEELDILAQMVAADRDTYGGTSSFGDKQSLDTDTFG